MVLTPKQELAVADIIADAISEGAHEWDAYAVPELLHTTARALRRVKEVLANEGLQAP